MEVYFQSVVGFFFFWKRPNVTSILSSPKHFKVLPLDAIHFLGRLQIPYFLVLLQIISVPKEKICYQTSPDSLNLKNLD